MGRYVNTGVFISPRNYKIIEHGIIPLLLKQVFTLQVGVIIYSDNLAVALAELQYRVFVITKLFIFAPSKKNGHCTNSHIRAAARTP